MSFEGYYRALCVNGHLQDGDVYSFDPEHEKCPLCGQTFVWTETIDQTNGGECAWGTKLKVKIERVVETCPTCHQITKILTERTYRIPKYGQKKVKNFLNS